MDQKYLKSHLLREWAERGKRTTSQASIPLMPNHALRRHFDHTSRGQRPRWPKKCYLFLTNYRCMTLTYQPVNTHHSLTQMPHGSLISCANWKRKTWGGSLALTRWFTTWGFTMSSLSVIMNYAREHTCTHPKTIRSIVMPGLQDKCLKLVYGLAKSNPPKQNKLSNTIFFTIIC